jgi:hypothetical protein
MALHKKPNEKVRWKTLAADCRKFRASIPMGLRQFGREAKLDKATICRAEQGKPLTVGSYFAVCIAYGLDPWDYIKQLALKDVRPECPVCGSRSDAHAITCNYKVAG